MALKALRHVSILQLLLFITVTSIVLLDIRFHLSSTRHYTKDLITLQYDGLVDGLTEDQSLASQRPPKIRYHDDFGQNKSTNGKFRKIAAHDLPPETRPGWVRDDNEVPVSRFPKCLLVGFSKCGTSSLLAFLNMHPDIVSLDWETDYFCDRTYFKYSLHWYRMRMPASTSNQITIEKSPCYVSERQALERIRAFNSSMKIMVILRDPITRILSQHGQYLASFKAAGKTKLSLEERYIHPKTHKLLEGSLQKWGIFTQRMENLFSIFPRHQIHVVDGDRFVKDPLPVLTHIERFLGVQRYFTPKDVFYDSAKGFFCPRSRTSNVTECMGYQKGRPHVEMSSSLKRKLQAYLRPHSLKLFDLIGEQLNWRLTDDFNKWNV